MYSKKEATQIRHDFWISFGRYLSLHLSSEAEKINWINYRTGNRHIVFRMDTGKNFASISVIIIHPDNEKRLELYNRLLSMKSIMKNHLNEEWDWQPETMNAHGLITSSISRSIHNVNVLNRDHWPEIISFLKPRIISLDAFWNEIKQAFDVY